MKNAKITIALVAVIATVVLVISAYNYDPDYNRHVYTGGFGTAVRDTAGVVTDTAEGAVHVASSAVKDTASILTTGERRSQKEVRQEEREKKNTEHTKEKEKRTEEQNNRKEKKTMNYIAKIKN